MIVAVLSRLRPNEAWILVPCIQMKNGNCEYTLYHRNQFIHIIFHVSFTSLSWSMHSRLMISAAFPLKGTSYALTTRTLIADVVIAGWSSLTGVMKGVILVELRWTQISCTNKKVVRGKVSDFEESTKLEDGGELEEGVELEELKKTARTWRISYQIWVCKLWTATDIIYRQLVVVLGSSQQ